MLGETLIQEVRDALDAHESAITASLEGARDFARVANNEPDLANEAARIASGDQQRLDLMNSVRSALDNLVTRIVNLEQHGFPQLFSYAVKREAYEQMKANAATIEAALARATPLPEPATGGTFALGEGTDKTS